MVKLLSQLHLFLFWVPHFWVVPKRENYKHTVCCIEFKYCSKKIIILFAWSKLPPSFVMKIGWEGELRYTCLSHTFFVCLPYDVVCISDCDSAGSLAWRTCRWCRECLACLLQLLLWCGHAIRVGNGCGWKLTVPFLGGRGRETGQCSERGQLEGGPWLQKGRADLQLSALGPHRLN